MRDKQKYMRLTYSYLAIRKAIGWIGILLPFVLMIGGFCFNRGFEESISDYYYTQMGDVFVGCLFAIALFMFFYTGYDNVDNITGNFAGIFAIGTALFPTPKVFGPNVITSPHFAFAGLLFTTLAFFSFFIFTRGDKKNKQKRKRNIIYRTCALVMVLSLGLSAIFLIFFIDIFSKINLFFWGETAALVAFGVSWLTKGGHILSDKKEYRLTKKMTLLKRSKKYIYKA